MHRHAQIDRAVLLADQPGIAGVEQMELDRRADQTIEAGRRAQANAQPQAGVASAR